MIKLSVLFVSVAWLTANAFAGDLANLSFRGDVPANSPIIVGFTLSSGGSAKNLLIRAIGPGLAAFGVPNYAPDPSITIYTGSTPVASNNDWQSPNLSLENVFASVWAFPLGANSKDAAVLFPATAIHTAHVSCTAGPNRNVLAELYDTGPGSGKALLNLSVRTDVEQTAVGIVGFVISGSTGAEVLIRAMGPSLGVPNPMPDPILTLYNASGTPIGQNNNWGQLPHSSAVLTRSNQLGAFPPSTNDAMLHVYLAPGAYTAHVAHNSSNVGPNKTVLVELYKGANTISGSPGYEPSFWGTVQGEHLAISNNCYNYAANQQFQPIVIDNPPYPPYTMPVPWAKPGLKSGQPIGLEFTENQMKAAVVGDGLIPIPYENRMAVAPSGYLKVALFRTTPNGSGLSGEFHFYRQDSNGRWSHKDGGSLATDKDGSNQPITNPETANRLHFTTLVGYYWVPSGTAQGSGQLNIQ